MTNSKTSGRPQELAGGSDKFASPSILNFYAQTYNSIESCNLNFDVDRSNRHLPACIIGGNCPEEGIEERITGDGQTIVRDIVRNRFTVESADGRSTFYQDGKGSNAYRAWTAADGRMIVRERDRAQIFLRGSHRDGFERRGYEVDLENNTVSRKSGGWIVKQHTTNDGDPTPPNLAEGELHLNVIGEGEDRQTSLEFAAGGKLYHASKDGIEIVVAEGSFRLLLSQGILYALTPIPAEQNYPSTELHIGADGISYRRMQIPKNKVDGVMAELGLAKDGAVTVDGLSVFLDANGNVVAHTAEASDHEQLSIIINADGTQSVTSCDGYTSRIGPDGRVLIFDPEGNCEAFFDPFTGVIGNGNVQLGAEFSCVDGLHVNLMGMVFEMVALHRFAQDRAQANAEAANALKQSEADVSFAKNHLQAGTVGNHCFAALSGSINQLTAALGACLASGARENIAAIVAALGEVYTHMALSHFKYNSYLAGKRLGIHDSYTLAKLQKNAGATCDVYAEARQSAPASAA